MEAVCSVGLTVVGVLCHVKLGRLIFTDTEKLPTYSSACESHGGYTEGYLTARDSSLPRRCNEWAVTV